MPRADYFAQRGGGGRLLKEGVDACRVRAPVSYEGRNECIEMGGVLKEGGDDFPRAFDCAFTHMQGVAHDALNGAAVALGDLAIDDLAPLLDPSPLPYGASDDM